MPSHHRFATPGLLVSAAFVAACHTPSHDFEATATPASYRAEPQERIIERMAALARPTAAHARLEPLVGTFAAKSTVWMDPGAPPVVSEGESTNRWVLGGRFLEQRYRGRVMGQPFQGIGMTGFNNATGQYEGQWADTTGTMMMPLSTGSCDDTGRVFTFRREFDDPMSNQRTKTRERLEIHNSDRHTFEWFQTGPDGTEQRTLLIEYTRNP